MAKTRKAAKKTATKKSVAKKATGSKKTSGAKKKAAAPKLGKELDLKPLKRQIKAHVEMLSRATGGDRRISDAIASLRRVQQELDDSCDPTMTIPLA